MTDDFQQTYPGGAAHAATEMQGDDPTHDGGMEMLGRLAVYCMALAVVAIVTLCWVVRV